MTDMASAIKEVLENSSQLTTWALYVYGGSVASIISTAYIRPAKLILRLSYLLFLPGWACLAFSVYCGEQLTRKYLAAIMGKPEMVLTIASDTNNLFADQRSFLFGSVIIFGIWLVLFLVQWVFVNSLFNGVSK